MDIGWNMAAYMGVRAFRELEVRSRDFNQGSIHETGKDTDLALQGSGFFKIQTPQGNRYTRNGNFRLSPDLQLVTQEGYQVMGKNGPITLDSLDKEYTSDAEGGVHLDKNLGDQILVVDFPNPQDLRPWGQNLLVAGPQTGEEQEAPSTRILQGDIEESNVDMVSESVSLIDIQRRYEAYLKVLDTFTESDRKVVEEIGQQA
jgi:flagellar basal-body rod protein FlgF